MKLQAGLLAAPDAKGNAFQAAAICCLLLLAVGLVFGQTARFEFINLDDTADVYLNPHVTGGLTADAVKWAFGDRYAGTWMPVTWISHMLDCQVYGLKAGGHHLTNVLLHAATAVILFLALRQMTGRLWPSAFVAAVFAIHPLRVESVAWVTERKDVLSGLFFALTLAAYAGYVRHRFSLLRYMAVVVLFLLGLMAKPMLVTLPFLLLLLDYWPLGRWTVPVAAGLNAEKSGDTGAAAESPPRSPQGAGPAGSVRTALRLVLEKVPLLAVSAVSSIVVIWAYGSEGHNLLDQRFTLSWRLGNAPLSYVTYLGMFFWPANLATPYPRPGLELPLARIVAAVVALVILTAAALLARRKYPYVLVGWLWYLGMLFPVSGVLQFGMQTIADRFTYLPQIGLCLALTWGLADALKSWRPRRVVYAVAGTLLLLVLGGLAWRQTTFWRDNFTLWNHTLACVPRSRLAHHALGNAYQGLGQFDKAIEHYEAAIDIEPGYAMSHYNLGVALATLGFVDRAIEEYRTTVKLEPNNAVALNNLGNALALRGQIGQGLAHCQQATRLDPQFAEAHYNVGLICHLLGRLDEAMAAYRRALAAKPDYDVAHYALGRALADRGRLDEAILEYSAALETNPDFAAEVHNTLGLALVARGRSDEAVTHYRKALALKPGFSQAQENLDRALPQQPAAKSRQR